MPQYTWIDPKAEVLGRSASGMVSNIKHEEIDEILKKHHLDQMDMNGWYPVQAVLDVLSEVSDNTNASENLVAVGMRVGEIGVVNLPAEFANASLVQVLEAYCTTIFQGRHRGNVGTLSLNKDDPSHLIVTACVPYPDDLIYGIFFAYARHFTPRGERFVVRYDETIPRREQGGDKTIIHILLGPGKPPDSGAKK